MKFSLNAFPSMPLFRRIIVSAALAGLLSGLLLTVVQQFQVVPLLLEAEVYEAAGESASGGHLHGRTLRGHDDGAPAHPVPPPSQDWERMLLTTLANVVMAVGFALLLGAAIALRGEVGPPSGLLWGAAGYAVFFVAPSLGLPPELPGTAAAHLTDRQLWWVLTVALSAAGLWIIAFAGKRPLRLLGTILLVAPHVLGAPQPQFHSSATPEELVRTFVLATSVANGVFWLTLGGLLGLFYRMTRNSTRHLRDGA